MYEQQAVGKSARRVIFAVLDHYVERPGLLNLHSENEMYVDLPLLFSNSLDSNDVRVCASSHIHSSAHNTVLVFDASESTRSGGSCDT